jgi:hypothetical protein
MLMSSKATFGCAKSAYPLLERMETVDFLPHFSFGLAPSRVGWASNPSGGAAATDPDKCAFYGARLEPQPRGQARPGAPSASAGHRGGSTPNKIRN